MSRVSTAGRSVGVLPLIAGVASAIALTGAAFYTVEAASCGDPGQYIRHDDHLELVGGCVDGSSLPHSPEKTGNEAVPQNYRP
ncbi:hypothetical protein [Amycolatopsis albispora]|uniref:Uncharacterized protein n=1 Tax=Amycolatopsis albispora TaxID=1804986 RepID=A0A344LAR0_9PSEU|nr:hypothetical protein [Amycolatopsis albispora]AXB45134.1 hypothetical protein A4R43_23710 [Amycolatopsis albispora]